MFGNVRTVYKLISIPNGSYCSGQTGEEYDTGSIDISYSVYGCCCYRCYRPAAVRLATQCCRVHWQSTIFCVPTPINQCRDLSHFGRPRFPVPVNCFRIANRSAIASSIASARSLCFAASTSIDAKADSSAADKISGSPYSSSASCESGPTRRASLALALFSVAAESFWPVLPNPSRAASTAESAASDQPYSSTAVEAASEGVSVPAAVPEVGAVSIFELSWEGWEGFYVCHEVTKRLAVGNLCHEMVGVVGNLFHVFGAPTIKSSLLCHVFGAPTLKNRLCK